MATATATDATATAPKAKRNRKPSAFSPKIRVTLSSHAEVGNLSVTEVGQALTDYFSDFAVRTVSRTRKARKAGSTGGPANLMVYIAPAGFTWAAAAERGVRLDAETAGLLRQIAETAGLDPNDPAAIVQVAKMLAQKATAAAAE